MERKKNKVVFAHRDNPGSTPPTCRQKGARSTLSVRPLRFSWLFAFSTLLLTTARVPLNNNFHRDDPTCCTPHAARNLVVSVAEVFYKMKRDNKMNALFSNVPITLRLAHRVSTWICKRDEGRVGR